MDDLLTPGRSLRDTAGGFRSALGPDAAATTYDRQAALYDRVIGSRPYNRIVWSTRTEDYTGFARRAVADDDGPLLDAACGSLVFSAAAYREATRRLVLCDLSRGMLERAAGRVPVPRDTLIQADLFDLPFAPASFTTVASFAALHCIGDLDGALAALRAQLAPGGRLFASSLVAETPVARRMLKVLHRAGEVAPPRSEARFVAAVERHFGAVEAERRGAMAYVVSRPV